MRTCLRLLLPACGLTLLCVTDAAAACDAPAGRSGAQAIDVDGVRRSFVVRVPPGSGDVPAPVVFAFHPFGMNASYMQSRAPVARPWPEAIVVYPDAAPPSRGWQTGPDAGRASDLRFFDAMVAWLDTHACIDRAHIVTLGYSNGGQFVHRLACERAGVVTAVAIAAGRLTCTPGAAVPVILSHGLADTTAPYTAAVDAAQAWAQQNACTSPPAIRAVGCAPASGCGAATVLCTYAGGHEYDPSFTARAVEFFKEQLSRSR